MPDLFIQFHEIDKQIADFDRRENKLTQDMKMLDRRLRDHELAKAMTDPKQLESDLVLLRMTYSSASETLKQAEKDQVKLLRAIESIPVKVEERVARHLENDYANKPEGARKLAAVKLKHEISAQLAKSQIAYQTRYDRLSVKADELADEARNLARRIETLEKVLNAYQAQSINPTDINTVQKTFKQLTEQHDQLARERSVFNRNDGKTGQKAKMRLQSELMDKVNVALRTHGFVDTLSTIEYVLKGITELDGTERTYLAKTTIAFKGEILSAAEPQDAVRGLVVEGDLSPELARETDKIVTTLDQAVESNKAYAAIWWRTGREAKLHLDKIHGLLVTKFKNRFRRAWREDLRLWIKKELS
jgi:hypothetical protein